ERPSADGAFQSILSGGGLQAAFIDEKARFLGVTLGEGGRVPSPDSYSWYSFSLPAYERQKTLKLTSTTEMQKT
ncbi:MAG: hypothetical protein IIT64_01835, partial [Bacteroidaceae bacterium]|nr:hypothetical protein [Bacteroidaceae bacterium]